MNAQQVLEASGLFESNSDIRTIVKQKGCKINGQVVDNINEEIELGDFLNFVWLFPGAAQAVQEHGPCFLLVSRGKKQKNLLRVMPDGSLVDGVQFLSLSDVVS